MSNMEYTYQFRVAYSLMLNEKLWMYNKIIERMRKRVYNKIDIMIINIHSFIVILYQISTYYDRMKE